MAPRSEVEAEQAYVDRAHARLETLRAQAEERARRAAGPGQRGTPQALLDRDAFVHAGLRRWSELSLGRESLVFGRIDRTGGERFYIGRVAVADQDLEPLVVDWRAPVAEPYYRATGRNPMGLARRRHFLCSGRRILDLEDDLLDPQAGAGADLIGEGALMAALERSRTGRMRDIVATIQAEQDEVIRAPLGDILVVQGGPGTGKTAVALHRAAYLLYTHRARLRHDGVLVIGPSPTFLRYIEHVLPSLGEDEVRLATAGGLLPRVVPALTDSPPAARVKGDPRMAEVLARAAAGRLRPLASPLTVLHERYALRLSPAESRSLVAAVKRRAAPHNSRRPLLERLVLGLLHAQYRAAAAGAGAAGARWSGSAGVDRQEFEESMRAAPAVVAALDHMCPLLTPEAFLAELYATPEALAEAGRGILEPAEIEALARPGGPLAWSEHDVPLLDEAAVLLGPAGRRRAAPSREPAGEEPERWAIERLLDDLPASDEAMRAGLVEQLLAGFRDATRAGEGAVETQVREYGHLLVDEAQGLSPMQWRMLARRCPRGAMTIFGDLGQAAGPWAPRSWEEILPHLPARAGHRIVELTINYRTPAEIMDVAALVLAAAAPQLRPPRSIRRAGALPVFVRAEAGRLGQAARDAVAGARRAAGEGRVAVVLPPSLLEPARAWLPHAAADGPLDVLDSPVASLQVDEARGLEFDAVVVVEPAAIVREHPNGLHALYVAITRATKRLTVVHAEDLPPAMAGAAPLSVAAGRRYALGE